MVDLVVRHPGRQFPLGFPALPHHRTERVNVTTSQSPGAKPREVTQEVKLGARRLHLGVLLGQDGVRATSDACIEEHYLLLHSPAVSSAELQLLSDHPVTGPESDVPYPAKRSYVLVLLSDGFSAAFDLDHACLLGELFRRHLPSLIGEQRV